MARRQDVSECRCANSGPWGRPEECEEPGCLVFVEEASVELDVEGGSSVERIMVNSKGGTAAPHLEEERLSCVGVREAQLLLWRHSFI